MPFDMRTMIGAAILGWQSRPNIYDRIRAGQLPCYVDHHMIGLTSMQ